MCIFYFLILIIGCKLFIYNFYFYQFQSESFTDFIPNLKKEKKTKNESNINEEIQKNKILEEEIKKLKDNLNTIRQNQTIEVNRLKTEFEQLKSENEKLKSELFRANKIIIRNEK